MFRLLEMVAPVVMAAYTRHELAAAAGSHQAMAAPVMQQHHLLIQQFGSHKKAFQPSMAQPSR